jgi:predicted CxxxxCH...CXXCH cytochrome family protein
VPQPLFGGTHADGEIEVAFAPARAGDDASFDANQRTCNVRCHARGGAREHPAFHEPGPVGCGDCHGSPPADHYAGACQGCHREANADGSALERPTLHLNGRVDFGAGGQACGACHGHDDDPMPPTGAHALHMASELTAALSCKDCHAVPSSVASPGHLDRGLRTPADVVFGERARARGQMPSYEAGACSAVACHGAGLAGAAPDKFVWAAADPVGCVTCHAAPPPPPHPSDRNCASTVCHGSEVSVGAPALGITPGGRSRHIDGIVQHGAP